MPTITDWTDILFDMNIQNDNFAIWVCPKCHCTLENINNGLKCTSCNSSYEVFGGIPDFRLPGESWKNHDADKESARKLLAKADDMTTEEFVHYACSLQPGWDEARIELRTQGVMNAPHRLQNEIKGWLKPCVTESGLLLDLGCGPGMLLASAASVNRRGIGIDVSLEALVLAQKLIREWGGKPVLAAAMAEALPLTDGSVSSVVSLDVMEHVADPGPYLREINRVTVEGGRVAISTPNRYSFAAEPHVFVWGVGLLPRRFQKRYVKWRSGKSYDFTQLLSAWELKRLFRKNTRFSAEIFIPEISAVNINAFPPFKAMIAKIYNRLINLVWLRWVFLFIGPFFNVIGSNKRVLAPASKTKVGDAGL